MWKLSLPLTIPVSKNRSLLLNLNVYRNAHYQSLDKAKKLFKEFIKSQLEPLPKFDRVHLRYTLYPKTKRLCDIANICSIVDKFFSDALVETGHLEDDNYNFVQGVSFFFGSVDSENPRVDVEILPVTNLKETDPMQITLVQSEIEQAIKSYVNNFMPNINGDLKIDLSASRGVEGFKATIDIVERGQEESRIRTGSKAEPDKAEITDQQEQHFDDGVATTCDMTAEAPKQQPSPQKLFNNLKNKAG